MKVIFGAGVNELETNANAISNATDFNQYQMSKIINNKFLGELPPAGSTIYIYYTAGGGSESNIALNTMTSISYVNPTINGVSDSIKSQVKNSLSVTNTTPAVSGRDELTNDEIRTLIKYNNSSQDRCVTVKDYYNRVMTMNSDFGAPIKVGTAERNNKVLITMLGLAPDGSLSSNLSEALINNIITYLGEYRSINDYVEIQPGRIVNLRFEVDITVLDDKTRQDVAKSILLYIGDYMDINNHKMGDEIYVSKMKSDIGAISGVKNLVDFRVYNVYGNGYSSNQIIQPIVSGLSLTNMFQVDLTASDGVLYSDDETMFEIKNVKKDIVINIKTK